MVNVLLLRSEDAAACQITRSSIDRLWATVTQLLIELLRSNGDLITRVICGRMALLMLDQSGMVEYEHAANLSGSV